MAKYSETQIKHLKRYLEKDFRRETSAWIGIIRYYSYFLLVVLVLIVAAIVHMRPLPPTDTYLATGQADSSYTALAQDFRKVFAKNGLNLELVTTTGLQQGLQDLNDDKSRVNASFVAAGTGKAEDYENLVSLGSVQVSPIWLFYRGKEIHADDPFAYFANRRIAIGLPGAVTNRLFYRLMAINHPDVAKQPNFQELTHADAADKLIQGSLDAMLVVNGFESETIRKLLAQPDIHIYNFALADAYLKKLPMLEKVVIPRGSIDLGRVRPNQDITLLASNINLLVEKNVHPAVQWAFIKAAREINNTHSTFFHRPGHFPDYLDKTFPLSDTAERYYANGVPQVFAYLPLWAAALIDNLWVVALTLIVVIFPLGKKIIGIRAFNSKKVLWDMFKLLRYLEEKIPATQSVADARKVLDEIAELESLVLDSWFEDQDVRFFFSIKSAVEKVKKAALDHLKTLQVSDSSTSGLLDLELII